MRPDLPSYADLAGAIETACKSGGLTKGHQLRAFEEDASRCVGTSDAVGLSSCTTGLMLVLRSLAVLRELRYGCQNALGCNLPDADSSLRNEVIVPSFIFLAAPAAIVWAGLRPVFVDIDPTTFTVDPQAVAAAMTSRTAAILACHTFGCPCDVESLTAIGHTERVPLIVDAAHGFGASRNGRQVGSGGLAQVFSLSPTKLVVAGEGGIVATSSSCLAELIRVGREYGNDGNYGCDQAGPNGRLPEISAIIGRASLARLPDVAARRRIAAQAYVEALTDTPGIGFQQIPGSCASSWKDFCISVDPAAAGVSRDGLMRALADRGIDTRAYYSPACHRMTAFAGFQPQNRSLPVTDRLAGSLVALPTGVHVTPDVARLVAEEIRRIIVCRSETIRA